jgi:hypothetical protein
MKETSNIELRNVSPHGFWFLTFKEFPWFEDASIRELSNVVSPGPHHLYWPDLDVDPAVTSIEHPEQYPHVSKSRPNKRRQPSRAKHRAKPETQTALD